MKSFCLKINLIGLCQYNSFYGKESKDDEHKAMSTGLLQNVELKDRLLLYCSKPC